LFQPPKPLTSGSLIEVGTDVPKLALVPVNAPQMSPPVAVRFCAAGLVQLQSGKKLR
jgi:hypothetical protein